MKRVVSFIIAAVMFGTYNNIFSMFEDSDPIKPEDRYTIRTEFKRASDSNPGNTHLPIEISLRKPSSSNYQKVTVYNMQHLVRFERGKSNFLKTMINLYVNAQEAVVTVKFFGAREKISLQKYRKTLH